MPLEETLFPRSSAAALMCLLSHLDECLLWDSNDYRGKLAQHVRIR